MDAIPVTVAEDAAARVAEWGMQREFEQRIEHAREGVPHLPPLRVRLAYDPERPLADPGLVIGAQRDYVPSDDSIDRTDWDYAGWLAHTFPPQVCMHVVLISVYGDAHEG